MDPIEEVLAANRRVAADVATSLPAPPARGLAVVTCMDARIDPAAAFGLAPGDAHVIRNAGGRVTADVIRSLAVSAHILGTRAVAVVHHTGCGMLAPDPGDARRRLEEAAGTGLGELELLTFSDEEAAVREDVDAVRRSPLVPGDAVVRGLLYDLPSGLLREVG